MKKTISLVLLVFAVALLAGCKKGPVLHVLNWNQYINEDLVEKFEKEFNVTVNLEGAESNESMYSNIKGKKTKYDIAIPSDYMMHKLYNEGLLHELDFELLPNYSKIHFDENLEHLRNSYFKDNQKYGVPYFWGTLGIMYNDNKYGVRELVETNEWEVFFNKTLTGDAKVGMYDSSRDAIAAAQLFLGNDLNSKAAADLKEAEDLLKAQRYTYWRTDELKSFIATGNLDIALVYSGDFFDMLYATMEDKLEVTYGLHVPTTNNVWFDAMVIPKTSANTVMAHNFINFMIDQDNAYENATAIGYCPPIAEVYAMMQEDEDYVELIETYPYYPGIVTNGTVYADLGNDVYKQMEIILSNVKK